MIVGDTHGEWKFITPKIKKAGDAGITHVMVCGDFGLWTHFYEGQVFLDKIQAAAEENNLSVFAIGGNHENWDHWNWMVDNFPTARGWVYARSRVLLAPKVHKWKWAGKQFVGAGGAVSIDKAYRLTRESGKPYMDATGRMRKANAPAPRTLYWDNEQLTDDDVQTIKNMNVKADYLITHDCSDRTPFYARLKPDMDSQIHRQRIDEVLRVTKPNMHFHGHMHNKFDWMNLTGDDHWTQTYGLECNNDEFSWGTLDVETGRFVWKDTVFRTPEEVAANRDARRRMIERQ